MGQTLYWECASGISGDMAVASLLDLGADENGLRRVLESMPVSGFNVEISRVKKSGLDVCDFNVKLDVAHENHDHDMNYLHGDAPQLRNEDFIQDDKACKDKRISEHQNNEKKNSDMACQCAEDFHSSGRKNDEEHRHHEHRGLAEIEEIIANADMSENAKNIAAKTFKILAKAEAKAHGVEIGDVHFHEVGAVDSIADIISAAYCLDNLGVTQVIVPFLCEGRGTVRCQHGVLPIPVPAVTNIAQQNGLKLRLTDVEGELVTPTGAALVAAVRTGDVLPKNFIIKKVGMGAGKRNYERPGILRAMLIDADTLEKEANVYKLETNIDDSTGEMLGYVMDALFEGGARDVHYTPVFMKKNRPAYLLTVICDEEKVQDLENIIFRETTTIGIRRAKMERTVLERSNESVPTKFGELKVKCCVLPDGTVRKYPEYKSAAALAKANGVALQEIMNLELW